MANEAIGHIKCPWCASQRARVSLDKSGRVNVTCSACHSQTFARGQLSDMAIRQAMTPVAKAPAPVEPAAGEAIAVPGALEAAGGAPAPDQARQVEKKAPARPAVVKEAAPVAAPEVKPAAPAVKGKNSWEPW